MTERALHPRPHLVGNLPGWSLQSLLLIAAVCIFVPFSPGMPGAGLDPSWVYGINQAVAQGMAFGREIIYTFGPYGAVVTKIYHPETDALAVAAALYLGLLYGIALVLAAGTGIWRLLVGFLVILVGNHSEDALFFSYPLLAGVLCLEATDVTQGTRPDASKGTVLTFFLFTAFGLLPLIKGSYLVICWAIAILALFLFAVSRKWAQALAVIVSITSSTALFWVVSGQSAVDLPLYVITAIHLVSGYTEGMSINGSGREIAVYVFVAAVLLGALLRVSGNAWIPRIFIVAVFLVYLLLAFKGGFVRHDGHATIAAASLLMATLIFSLRFRTAWSPVVVALAVLAWLYIESHYQPVSVQGISREIKTTSRSVLNGISKRITDSDWLERDFDRARKKLNKPSAFPVFEGTSDIYSFNQSLLIASGNNWNPRPVFQSYAAYTPALAAANKNHLLGEAAPDHIFFRVEPIDGHFPSIEDGPSWYPLLARYRPGALVDNYLYLHKSSEFPPGLPPPVEISRGTHTFGEVVHVPGDQALVFAEIHLKKNVLGEAISLLYRPDHLQISVLLKNGVTKTYRIIAGMAEAGFLLSPLVRNTAEFGMLYGNRGYLSNKRVASFSIAPERDHQQWHNTFEVIFRKAG